MISKKKLNGSHASEKKAEIEFPVTFILKVVFQTESENSNPEVQLEKVFQLLKIPFQFLDAKMSSKQTYISHSVRVTLLDKKQMSDMYESLRTIPGVKFAL